jgi:hypothetical protein
MASTWPVLGLRINTWLLGFELGRRAGPFVACAEPRQILIGSKRASGSPHAVLSLQNDNDGFAAEAA